MTEYADTMEAELCCAYPYDGPLDKGDESVEACGTPRMFWNGYCEGDKEGGEFPDSLELSPAGFPPGTRVSVEVPVCPKCGESADTRTNVGPPGENGVPPVSFDRYCDCGFDWEKWQADRWA